MAVETIGADTANSRGTVLTASASANTKGAWAQLVASSAAAAKGIIVVLAGPASATNDYLVDIGTGGSGSETAVISNLPFSAPSARAAWPVYVPLPIAAGTRVSARCQCGTTGSATMNVLCYLLPAQTVELQGLTNVVTYGAQTATTRGVSCDPGGTANTLGGYTELTAATSRDIDWIVPMCENLADTIQSNASWLVTFGTGTAGNEVAFLSNVYFMVSSVSNFKAPLAYPAIPIPRIASGTRISANVQCSINTAGDRLLGLMFLGCDGTAAVTATYSRGRVVNA